MIISCSVEFCRVIAYLHVSARFSCKALDATAAYVASLPCERIGLRVWLRIVQEPPPAAEITERKWCFLVWQFLPPFPQNDVRFCPPDGIPSHVEWIRTSEDYRRKLLNQTKLCKNPFIQSGTKWLFLPLHSLRHCVRPMWCYKYLH